jgi:hypothetical protein
VDTIALSDGIRKVCCPDGYRAREHNIRCQLVDLNAGLVDQLRHIQYLRCFEHLGTGRWSSESNGGNTGEKGKNQRVKIACTHNSSAMTAL